MSHREEQRRLRIILGQLSPKSGAIEQNERSIEVVIERAREERAQLVVLPQTALLGSNFDGLSRRPGFFDEQWEALERLAGSLDDKLAVVLGYVEEAPQWQGPQIGVALLINGVVRRLGAQAVIELWGHRLGFCAGSDASEVFDELVDDGATALISLCARPLRLGDSELRQVRFQDEARRLGRSLIVVNQAGGDQELIFDGRSIVVDGAGRAQVELLEFVEDFQLIELGEEGHMKAVEPKARASAVVDVVAKARDALVVGLRDFVHKSGFQRVLIGLSGGIDSALVAAIAAQALGPKNVYAIALPSRFSSDHGREDARLLAKNLGIEFDEISIEGSYQAALEALNPHFRGRGFDVTEENIQARLRGLYLMALSNKLGGLVLACSNKSELAVGYTTLYGDLCGALMPIGDVGKGLVYEIARLINREAGHELIPQRILEKAPSAELRPDQKDEDSLPPYEILDEIVARYMDERQKPAEIVAAGFEEATVKRVIKLIRGSEYKRLQIPPVLKLKGQVLGVEERYR